MNLERSLKYRFYSVLFFTCIVSACLIPQAFPESGHNLHHKKVLIFGGDKNFPPFQFLDASGRPAGYHIDLIGAIGDVIGYDIEIRLTQWDRVVREITINGTIDVTALAYHKRREETFLFSVPHLVETSEIFIRKETKGINSFDDLVGKQVIVMRNATTHMSLEDLNFDATYILVDAMPDALVLLSQGRYDAAIVGRHMGLSVIKRKNLNNLITIGEPLFPRDYVIATAMKNRELMDEINRGLNILKAQGHYTELNKKWFGSPVEQQQQLISRILYYGAAVIVPVLVVSCLILIWNRSLKNQVQAKTALIQAELEERKKAEAALIQSEARFKKLSREFKVILDGIPGILALFDAGLRIIWCNTTDLDNDNGTRFSTYGEQKKDILSQMLAQEGDISIKKCFESGNKIEYLDTDSRGRSWEIRGFPMKTSHGKIPGVLVHATDITENIRLREEAVAASRLASVGELSAGIAHEINNPTGLILLYVPLLKDFFSEFLSFMENGGSRDAGEEGFPYAPDRADIEKSLDGILECANRIKRTVDDLKNFAGQDPRNMTEKVDINACVRTAVRLTRGMINKSADQFTETYAQPAPCIIGNRQRMEQVVVNLINNACLAIENKKGGIVIETVLDSTGKNAVISIKDQGCGMSAGMLKRIKDPFFTTRRENGGTGIGLSISERLIREHNGRLEFESRPEKGTTARVILPLQKGG